MSKSFRVLKNSKKSKARAGELTTAHGKVKTPFFMTIATRGAVKTLAAEDMRDLHAPVILSNTYHLFVRPGMEIMKKVGGLHKFMGWDGPILTDSGGYQVFSLAAGNKRGLPSPPPAGGSSPIGGRGSKTDSPSPLVGEGRGEGVDYDVKITNDGAEFIDRLSGRKDLFTPERVLEIQKVIGSDIMMMLDVCAPYPVSYEGAKEAMEMTSAWAKRAKIKNEKLKMKNLLFGIVQGSVYKDLRQQSARELAALDFPGYAIGGVSVGESEKEKFKAVDWVLPLLPKEKPRYLMGFGQPHEIVEAVRRGVDMFDCVLPTRNARHGNLYVRSKSWSMNPPPWRGKHGAWSNPFYSVMHITNEKYQKDLKPVDPYCSCFTCTHHTRAYLRHLFKVGEPLAQRLATIHNVKFYLELMEKLQEGILEGRL